MATVHRSRWGTYHPNPQEDTAWTINDTRGYIDGGPSCHECNACECMVCEHNTPEPMCCCDLQPEGFIECIGLSFAFVCLDGGEALCEDCAEQEGVEVIDCDCP